MTEFWDRIVEVVEKKRGQFAAPEFADGVLSIDASPMFHFLSANDIPIGGTLVHLPAQDQQGPPGGEAPLIRYDESEFSEGLRRFENAIAGTGIRTLMLWNREFAILGNDVRRRIERRVIGTIGGNRFWAYFQEAVVFPGPEVGVRW